MIFNDYWNRTNWIFVRIFANNNYQLYSYYFHILIIYSDKEKTHPGGRCNHLTNKNVCWSFQAVWQLVISLPSCYQGIGYPWYMSTKNSLLFSAVGKIPHGLFVEGWAPLWELTFGRQTMAHRQSMFCSFDGMSNRIGKLFFTQINKWTIRFLRKRNNYNKLSRT